ncbi:uncharacterized protein L969DRAFT_604578 [Mixia osmundae IAM 14324]|uniref:Actin-like protein ARP6 n=1 Tax=Mixia osmundae (strain CBS 9802 / IAM 14324 / JCM 22182 / KY 12970) TaxID=764103 RepID=G7E3P7_MIXOS|nr:uncharacterized protein L969DRAFT_604578 [Mixia osmundae IAM 14324]KEI41883.1 hypothetical protein L969DRAFT_604578 [Mixia osmundae IAM 14324]GAA97457.1 hypothetical protein E5Q_04136 [Mixia osmundae IAM 14324]
MNDEPTLVVDNGAHSIKTCWASSSDEPSIVPNGIFQSKADKRTYVGADISQLKDASGLVYHLPFERGILTDWNIEKTVWDHTFNYQEPKIDPADIRLLLTEPALNLPVVTESIDQMVFEEYDFASACVMPAAALAPFLPLDDIQQRTPECTLVVDVGFSFSQIIPICRGQVQEAAVRRLDIGGKMLTNYLKETASFRHWYMMDQTAVVNAVKEACCYVAPTSGAFSSDLERVKSSRNDIVQEYILPDFTSKSAEHPLGHLRTTDMPIADEQILPMGNERFTTPEILFHPSIIGMDQMGLPEIVADAIEALPEMLRGLYWGNVICIGGSACLPGFVGRLQVELRELATEDYTVRVRASSTPITHAAKAARHILQHPELDYDGVLSLEASFVTREEYQEYGSELCRRRFRRDANTADLKKTAGGVKPINRRRSSGKHSRSASNSGLAQDDEDESGPENDDWRRQAVATIMSGAAKPGKPKTKARNRKGW